MDLRASSTRFDEYQSIIQDHALLYVQGNGSKPGVYANTEDAFPLEVTGLSGIIDYQPGEFTFTAFAGTPVVEIERELEANGQYLPFDPPLSNHGASLGGTVSAGLSGAGRYRYGGCRDFLLGVKFFDGQGNLVSGGGKVVKNAAGFDLPKMMVGSLGAFGALVEVTFKVFPRPQAYLTVRRELDEIDEAINAVTSLSRLPWEIHALDFQALDDKFVLDVRIGGPEDGLLDRAERLIHQLRGGEILTGEEDRSLWVERREFTWLPETHALVKVPVTPARIRDLDEFLKSNQATRVYSVGGNLAWVGWPGDIDGLDRWLRDRAWSGLVIRGGTGKPRLGTRSGESFYRRLKQALDPQRRWLEA